MVRASILKFLIPALALFLNASVSAEHAENQLLIKFKDNVTEDQKLQFQINNDLLLIDMIDLIKVHVFETSNDRDVVELSELLEKNPIVDYVELNQILRPQALPNDPKFNEQWYLDNQGQIVKEKSGQIDLDIDWPEAMDLFTGTTEVIVAVVDTGLALGNYLVKVEGCFLSPKSRDTHKIQAIEMGVNLDKLAAHHSHDLF